MNVIETERLTKYYGKVRGIENLELAVSEGDIFGFIGPNGAGKSTMIRTVLGLIAPTSGGARVFGLDSGRCRTEILSRVGYMPSEAMFYSGMTVHEIITYSAKLRKKDCTAESMRLCGLLELDTKKKVDELSLGNRKKVSIVCAFQHKPDLFILDEPTSGLDPFMQKAFFELVHERNTDGATFFLSSHVLSEIQRHCRTAAIIREGQLIALDFVDKLAETNARRVVLHGVSRLPRLDGIKDAVINGETVSFLYLGEIRELLGAISTLPLTDISVTEPELEEIFMHYYRKEST